MQLPEAASIPPAESRPVLLLLLLHLRLCFRLQLLLRLLVLLLDLRLRRGWSARWRVAPLQVHEVPVPVPGMRAQLMRPWRRPPRQLPLVRH
jgi:hypothetical protein